MTGLSRIYSNAHWSSDVFFGAAIGYFTSKALLSFHKEEENRIIITPQLTKDTVGVSVGYRF